MEVRAWLGHAGRVSLKRVGTAAGACALFGKVRSPKGLGGPRTSCTQSRRYLSLAAAPAPSCAGPIIRNPCEQASGSDDDGTFC